jgi:hypothetical protein
MNGKRSKTLREMCLRRDNFCCKKCGFEDKTGERLEAHHILPVYLSGGNNLTNLITLCLDCHHFAPDKKEELEEYLSKEITGTFTTFLKALDKVKLEHPELFRENKKSKKLEEKRLK